ncbi:MAG: DnaJ domain-containing protein [Hyphomicrobiaceae bacterium]
MQVVLFLVLAIVLVLIAKGKFGNLNAVVKARIVQQFGGMALMGLGGILVNRNAWIFGLPLLLAGGLLTSGVQLGNWRSWFPLGRGTAGGQTTSVKTEHLEMELDHDTGAMHGRIVRGVFRGRDIETMAPAEVALLWQDCRFADPQSAQLLEAYLDRRHPTWREDMARAEGTPGAGGIMTRGEAFEVLGLKPGATAEEVRAAHRDLMMRMHPDRGGSTYLAAKINQAKDLLLG